jgi:hypothetical protein
MRRLTLSTGGLRSSTSCSEKIAAEAHANSAQDVRLTDMDRCPIGRDPSHSDENESASNRSTATGALCPAMHAQGEACLPMVCSKRIAGPRRRRSTFELKGVSVDAFTPANPAHVVLRTPSGSGGTARISRSARRPGARSTATSRTSRASPSPSSTPAIRSATSKSGAGSSASTPTRATPSSIAWPRSTWGKTSIPGTGRATSGWCSWSGQSTPRRWADAAGAGSHLLGSRCGYSAVK